MQKIKMKPVLAGDFWVIGANPNLGDLQGRTDGIAGQLTDQECVDHHIYQSEDGMWHLLGCIRHTKIGRLLYHWRSEDLEKGPFEKTGEIIRASKADGECINNQANGEWIQSPYVIRTEDGYFMFYGGHNTGHDVNGNRVTQEEKKVESQMCLMTSKDGRNWVRYKNADGGSAIFIGPGEVRDPCLIKIDDLWYMYYAGYEYPNGTEKFEELIGGFWTRTSKDLYNWSEPTLVHRDITGKYGVICIECECPHVVFRNGYYYLFRTEDYGSGKSYVFRSENPLDFGINDASAHFVCNIPVGAPEIIVHDGKEYISSNHDLKGGTKLCRLEWVEDK